MNFKYNTLSAGYIGEASTNATLNSRYYALFFNEKIDQSPSFSQIMVFPQRIPRAEFFEELCSQETSYYKEHIDKVIANIKGNHKSALQSLLTTNSEQAARIYINWSNMLLRYGCFEHLINHFPKNYCGSFALEIELIKESAKIELLLSQDEAISIDELLELSERFLENPHTSDREKIMLLNQIVVNFYRYKDKSTNNPKVFDLSKKLLDLIQNFENKNFINMLYSSVAYRGLAMASEFGSDMQASFLKKAEVLARNMQGKSEIENIVAKENLYTFLQTMSKWNLFISDMDKTIKCLLEMIEIDPYDSTGQSELGFLSFQMEAYSKAAVYFKKSIELGPPGAGMNAYYYAKCLEMLGMKTEAINYLYESATLDKKAISPWLDLLEYYSGKNEIEHSKKIAKHIYESPILMGQLEEDEVANLQNILN